MFEYEFVKVDLKAGFWSTKPKKDYHKIINDYARKGWQFKQIFAPATSGYGSPSYFELIFERRIEG